MKFIVDNWMLILIALSSGGMLAWPMVRGANAGSLTAQGAVQLINRERAVVVDVREPEEFAAGHVTGAKNVPLEPARAEAAGHGQEQVVAFVACVRNGRAGPARRGDRQEARLRAGPSGGRRTQVLERRQPAA